VIKIEEPEQELLTIEDYENIDDTGCTVTPLISFDE